MIDKAGVPEVGTIAKPREIRRGFAEFWEKSARMKDIMKYKCYGQFFCIYFKTK